MTSPSRSFKSYTESHHYILTTPHPRNLIKVRPTPETLALGLSKLVFRGLGFLQKHFDDLRSSMTSISDTCSARNRSTCNFSLRDLLALRISWTLGLLDPPKLGVCGKWHGCLGWSECPGKERRRSTFQSQFRIQS
jgi:hypothetical protein